MSTNTDQALPPYQDAFSPVNANVRSFSSPILMKCRGHRSPGSSEARPRGAALCSRKAIASEVLFRKMNLGAKVMTFVSLYFPRPSVQDKPT